MAERPAPSLTPAEAARIEIRTGTRRMVFSLMGAATCGALVVPFGISFARRAHTPSDQVADVIGVGVSVAAAGGLLALAGEELSDVVTAHAELTAARTIELADELNADKTVQPQTASTTKRVQYL